MSNQIVISSGAKVRELEGVLTGTAGIVNALGINVPSGIPQLDGSGKILVSQLPNSVMEYKGSWNAATNTPTLVNGTGNAGDVYLCEVAGTVNFGAGPITFAVGDQVIYSGSIWQRASGATGTVTSVAVSRDGDAITITGSPITTSGTINLGFTGSNAQYINGEGDLVTFPSLTGFVPYTGATNSVDLGAFSLSGDTISGVGIFSVGSGTQSGYIGIKQGTTFLGNISGYNSINANATKYILISDIGSTNYKSASFELGSLTNNTERTYTLPDASGTLALTSNLSGYVPYTGATANVDLGTFDLTTDIINLNQLKAIGSGGLNIYSNSGTHIALMGGGGGAGTTLYGGLIGTSASFTTSGGSDTFAINHSSGSGIALNITKGGNGEGLYINKTSGSGNAATIIGTLNATTLVKSGGTSSQFLKADGSVDSNTYVTLDTTQTISGAKTFSGGATFTTAINVNRQINISKTPSLVSYTGGYITNYGTSNGIIYADGDTGNLTTFIYNFGGNYNYTFPASSGTIALTSNLSAYVPYSGATGAVNLGAFDLTVNGLKVGRGVGGISTNTVLGTTALNSNTTGSENTALGWNSLQNNTTGVGNTGVGAGSLYLNTTGSSNTALGYATLTANTTGTQNVAIGVGSLQNNTTASYNVAIGTAALSANTTGGNNTAIGFYALRLNTTGGNNTAIGISALESNTTGAQNVAIGTQSLQFNTTSNNNTAIGHSALGINTGAGNTAIGYIALSSNTTGSNNVAVGNSALNSSTTSNNNTAIGVSSLTSNTTGTQNTAIGINSGVNNTTGSGNSFLGYNAGAGITTGGGNTIVGNAGTLSSSLSNNIILADGNGNIRYQWNGTNNVFGNPISGTSATFSNQVYVNYANPVVRFKGATLDGYIINSTDKLYIADYLTATKGLIIDLSTGALSQIGGGAATFSSSVTAASFVSTNGNNSTAFNSASATTGWVQIAMNNTSGSSLLGVEGSTADTLATGSLAYASVLRNYTATAFQIATNNIVRATITSGGNVGIGTSSPIALLNIYGSTHLQLQNATTGSASSDGTRIQLSGSDLQIINRETADIISYTSDTERMRITSGGNVGIGTSSPLSFTSYTTTQISNTAGAGLFVESTTGSIIGQFFADNGYAGGAAVVFGSRSNHPLTFGTNNTERMRITSGGQVQLVGTTGDLRLGTNTSDFATLLYSGGGTYLKNDWASTSAFLDLLANSVGFRVQGTGNATLTGTLTQGVSDKRFKKNIEIIPNALEKINLINGYTFEYDLENEDLTYIPKVGRDIGVIAQEIEQIIPEAVSLAPIDRNEDNESKSGKNYLTVNYEKIIPLLIQSIKELKAEIDELKNK